MNQDATTTEPIIYAGVVRNILQSHSVSHEPTIATHANANALFDCLSTISHSPAQITITARRRRQPRNNSSWLDKTNPVAPSSPNSCLCVKYPVCPIGDGGVSKT